MLTIIYHYFTLPLLYHHVLSFTMVLPSFYHDFTILFPADLVLKTPQLPWQAAPFGKWRRQATQTLDDMLKLFTAPERLDKQNSWKRRGSTLVGSTLVASGDGGMG